MTIARNAASRNTASRNTAGRGGRRERLPAPRRDPERGQGPPEGAGLRPHAANGLADRPDG